MATLPQGPQAAGSTAAPGAAEVCGVVLAGGRGSRMGGADKGWIAHGGQPLVEQVLARLRPQVGALVISANRNLERYAALGCPVISDDAQRHGAFAGPLAGMLAALRHTPLPWIAVVPCDAPDLPVDLVARLARASGGGRATYAIAGGRAQPVFCLLPSRVAQQLDAALAGGEHRPVELLRLIDAVGVAFDEVAAFRNVNTPDQLDGACGAGGRG